MDASRENWVRDREKKRVHVRVWDDRGLETSGFTVDISPSGVFIESLREVDVGSRIHMELDANGRPFYSEGVVARVRRVHRSATAVRRPGFGVRFIGALEALGGGAEQMGSEVLEADLRQPETLARVYDRDLKLGVLTVRTSAPPPIGSEVEVRLLLPAPQQAVTVVGEVQAHLPEMPGVGLRLRESGPLRTLVEELLSFSA